MKIRNHTILIIALLIAGTSAIYIVGSSRYNIYPLFGSLGAFASPTKSKSKAMPSPTITAKGRALIRDENASESDRFRVTALVLAMDELIRKDQISDTPESRVPLSFSGSWLGFRLTSNQLSEGGLTRQQVVELTLKPDAQDGKLYRWKVVNQRLEIPESTQALNIELLKSELKKRGIEVHKGLRIGNSLWEQTLVYKP